MGDDEEAGWARVRIDGKDWGRVLSLGEAEVLLPVCVGAGGAEDDGLVVVVVVAVVLVSIVASRVNRSEILFN